MAVAFIFHFTLIAFFSVAASVSREPTRQDVFQRLMAAETRLSESEKEIKSLRENADVQKEIIGNQETDIKELQTRIADQNVVISSNKVKINDCSRTIKSLRGRLLQNVRLQSDVSEEKIGRENALVPEERHKSVIKDHSSNINKPIRSVAVGGRIAFTAYMDHDGNYGADQTIIFNGIITNEGNGYNKYTGVFTCPLPGMYLFSFFLWGRSDPAGTKQIRADLTVNGNSIVSSVAETMHVSEDAQGGNSAVIRLAQGDSVWIKVHYAGDHIAGNSIRFNTFTGLYLYS